MRLIHPFSQRIGPRVIRTVEVNIILGMRVDGIGVFDFVLGKKPFNLSHRRTRGGLIRFVGLVCHVSVAAEFRGRACPKAFFELRRLLLKEQMRFSPFPARNEIFYGVRGLIRLSFFSKETVVCFFQAVPAFKETFVVRQVVPHFVFCFLKKLMRFFGLFAVDERIHPGDNTARPVLAHGKILVGALGRRLQRREILRAHILGKQGPVLGEARIRCSAHSCLDKRHDVPAAQFAQFLFVLQGVVRVGYVLFQAIKFVPGKAALQVGV